MRLGAFSISLTVADLDVSIAFYSDLGFTHFGGADAPRYAIMKNGDTLIGLFEGLFEKNMLTFNPGWDQNAQNVDDFDDVRDLKATLVAAGYPIAHEQGGETGPASFMVIDPDGNPVLIDQHR